MIEGLDDELDAIINSMSEDEKKEETNVVTKEDVLPPAKVKLDSTDTDAMSDELINMVKDDRDKADQVFNLFYGNIAQNTDHSQASKEGLNKALELKIDASRNIIELLKIKSKAKETGNTIGVMFGAISPKKAGFDMEDITEASKDF